MAWENQLMNIGQVLSSGDMTSNQYRAVQLSTTNNADGAILTATRGGAVNGVWQDNSTVATAGAMMVLGVSKLAAGDSSGGTGAITRGTVLVASSAAQAVPSTGAGQHVIGYSLGNLSSDSTGTIPVMLTIGAIST